MTDAPDPIWPDEALEELMHIHPAQSQHDDVSIHCTAQALGRLKDVFVNGNVKDGTIIRMMCSDGEGYVIRFKIMDQWQMDEDRPHYAAIARAEKAEAACAEWSEVSQRNYQRAKKAEAALQSIADNTCCDGCQEAARVARDAVTSG